MRIGISVVSHEGQSIWGNGLGQNVFFLAQAFQRLPFVHTVVLIDVGNQASMPPQVDLQAMGMRRLTPHEAGDQVDVIVEMAGALDVQWLDLMRARGKKLVHYGAGQPFAGVAEPSVFNRPGHFAHPHRCDEIWVPPQYSMFAPLQRTLHRCPVRVVPYLWHPQFLQQRIDEVAKLGLRFGYAPPTAGEGLRVAIFEPNLSVAKTSAISMLACDEAYRADPSSIKMMSVLNTLHLKDHPTMLHLANSLDLVKQHKAVFLGRHDIVGFMVQRADAVVSHQWTNDQNYSYLDALWGNYPLVHNSPWLHGLSGAGYYYPGFDAAEGGRQLLSAWRAHGGQLDDYRARSQRVFDAVDPFSQTNLDAYASLLLNLCSDMADGAAA